MIRQCNVFISCHKKNFFLLLSHWQVWFTLISLPNFFLLLSFLFFYDLLTGNILCKYHWLFPSPAPIIISIRKIMWFWNAILHSQKIGIWSSLSCVLWCPGYTWRLDPRTLFTVVLLSIYGSVQNTIEDKSF